MTKSFAVNENNDLYIGRDGNLVIDVGISAIKDVCASGVKAQRGEMVFNTTSGMPDFQAIWVGTPNLQQFEAALRNIINNIDGVIRILDLLIDVQNGTLSYTIVILTSFGQEQIQGFLNVGNI